MASLSRTYQKKKLLGQIYTPLFVVSTILDKIKYNNEFLLGKSILDPACGDGRFLTEIVRRILEFSAPDQLVENLNAVNGWDIDSDALALCRRNLDTLIKHTGLKINWKLKECDALLQNASAGHFFYIVGNPPYIRIQHLPVEQRLYLQKEFKFCASGSTDIYAAFFELADRLLSPNGICGYITPNSYLFSETARPLRDYFLISRSLVHITNFGTARVFENVGTYTAITIFNKKPTAGFTYEIGDPEIPTLHSRRIAFEELTLHEPWQLSVDSKIEYEGVRLGDLCRISVGITTLCDKVFLLKKHEVQDNKVLFFSKLSSDLSLDLDLIKPVIKASKLQSSTDSVSEWVMFPYEKNDQGKYVIIPEDRLKRDFPRAYHYLVEHRALLDKRDNGKVNSVAWYAFGRNQALDSSFGEKIIFSPMNKTPKFIYSAVGDASVYSGYFIKFDGDCTKLVPILNSQRMKDYIAIAGRDFRGGWKGYNKKVVENFRLTPEEVESLKNI